MSNRSDLYAIVFDTNVLEEKTGKDFAKSWIEKSIEPCCDVIESMDAFDRFKILIPELVRSELMQHQLEQHKSFVETIKSASLPSWKFEYDPSSYQEILNGLVRSIFERGSFGMVSIEAIPYPPDNCFARLVERVLSKQPPFEGGNGKSDKGFKDAVIWESVLEYKRTHVSEQMILVSRDKIFNNPAIRKEYEDEFGEDIVIVDSANELITHLRNTVDSMKRGYRAPEFVDEAVMIESLLKYWVFDNIPLLQSALNIPYEDEGKVKVSFDGMEEADDGKLIVSASLMFGSGDMLEILSVPIFFEVAHNQGEDEYLLESYSLNGVVVAYGENLEQAF